MNNQKKKNTNKKVGNKKGRHYTDGKNKIHLFPPFAMSEIGKVYTKGAAKHDLKDDDGNIIELGDNNWRKGWDWSIPLSSLERHLNAFKQRKDFDDETGCYHMAHIAWNAIALLEFYKIYPEGDDRVWYGPHNKRVGLDIDGVLADFASAFTKLAIDRGLNQNYKFDSYKQHHWYFPYEWNQLWEEVYVDKDFWLNLKPLVDPTKLPFEPTAYVTARRIPKEWTEEWLAKNNFPCQPVIVTDGDSKINHLQDLDIDIFVDDSYETWLELTNAGICTFLIDRSYNIKHDVGHFRLKNIEDLF